ncbi:hypothetical protein GGF37_000181 [Kickxella alabastrina]|nr:hypothetical protein GGF37_000181 [Kickxella alabastrina]
MALFSELPTHIVKHIFVFALHPHNCRPNQSAWVRQMLSVCHQWRELVFAINLNSAHITFRDRVMSFPPFAFSVFQSTRIDSNLCIIATLGCERYVTDFEIDIDSFTNIRTELAYAVEMMQKFRVVQWPNVTSLIIDISSDTLSLLDDLFDESATGLFDISYYAWAISNCLPHITEIKIDVDSKEAAFFANQMIELLGSHLNAVKAFQLPMSLTMSYISPELTQLHLSATLVGDSKLPRACIETLESLTLTDMIVGFSWRCLFDGCSAANQLVFPRLNQLQLAFSRAYAPHASVRIVPECEPRFPSLHKLVFEDSCNISSIMHSTYLPTSLDCFIAMGGFKCIEQCLLVMPETVNKLHIATTTIALSDMHKYYSLTNRLFSNSGSFIQQASHALSQPDFLLNLELIDWLHLYSLVAPPLHFDAVVGLLQYLPGLRILTITAIKWNKKHAVLFSGKKQPKDSSASTVVVPFDTHIYRLKLNSFSGFHSQRMIERAVEYLLMRIRTLKILHVGTSHSSVFRKVVSNNRGNYPHLEDVAIQIMDDE